MTGCRLDEVEGLLKTEVDPVGMALRLGDSKTGKSIRHVGPAVIAVLKTAMAKSKSKFVFPAITTESKHHTGLTRWLKKVSAKDVPGITCHGLRHSFSSTAEDIGYSIPTIKALIGHPGRASRRDTFMLIEHGVREGPPGLAAWRVFNLEQDRICPPWPRPKSVLIDFRLKSGQGPTERLRFRQGGGVLAIARRADRAEHRGAGRRSCHKRRLRPMVRRPRSVSGRSLSRVQAFPMETREDFLTRLAAVLDGLEMDQGLKVKANAPSAGRALSPLRRQ